MTNDRRLIEDFLPIQAISAEASRKKSVCKSVSEKDEKTYEVKHGQKKEGRS
ncbi:MAG: hypothetical protein QME44_04940 [Thermodesulfobacteriota bacterium]|nr:hypothetical protein [Thermodesulfobacteriota bacterium]